MRPLPKTVIQSEEVPAPLAEELAAALSALDDEPSAANAEAVFAAAARLPFTTHGERCSAEWQALAALAELGAREAGRRAWLALAVSWSARAPLVGTEWVVMARTLPVLDVEIPPRLHGAVRTAWAWGVLSQTFEYKAGASKAPSEDGSAAWAQACIEVTLQNFERARACVDLVRKARGFDYSGRCVEIMLRREQGDLEGARASHRELVALAHKRKACAYWDVIAALSVILDVDDGALKAEILAAWTTKGKDHPTAIYAS
jgi:hypothetical protein